MEEAAVILLLSELPGVGEKTLGTVLRRCAARQIMLCDLLRRDETTLRDLGFAPESVKALRSVTHEMRSAAEAAARGLRAAGIQILTFRNSSYPARLLERLADPPPVLYAYGSLDLLSGTTFAVANSNDASEAALALCDAAAEPLVQARWRPVTGHNRGAYQRTALAALRFGGPVCYVLDRGLLEAFDGDLSRELFPAAHVWSHRFDPTCTLALSPFTPRAHGIALHNRRRDELVFSLADAVLVGEVRPGGQMERCALAALEQGITVRLVGPPAERDERFLAAGALRGLDGLMQNRTER